jgi:hypothetical protein
MNQRTRARAPKSATPPIATPTMVPPVREWSEEVIGEVEEVKEGVEDREAGEGIDVRREEEGDDKGDTVGVACEDIFDDMACDDGSVVVFA